MRSLLVTLAVLIIVVACSRSGGGENESVTIEESPLATWDTSGLDAFTAAGFGGGTLEISTGCVLLVRNTGEKLLLVWPEPTTWNVAEQAIEFVSPIVSDERVELRHGDRVVALGGSENLATSRLVSEPTADCLVEASTVFYVSEVQTE